MQRLNVAKWYIGFNFKAPVRRVEEKVWFYRTRPDVPRQKGRFPFGKYITYILEEPYESFPRTPPESDSDDLY